LDVPRSSAYYRAVQKEVDLEPLKALIRVVRVTFPGCGVRKMYAYLVRDYTRYTRQQVRRAYVEMGLLGKVRPRRIRTTDSSRTEQRFPNLLKGLVLTGPNHAWVGDVTFLRVGMRFAYLALIMDAFSRAILGWALSTRNDTALARRALEMALETGRPKLHHTDQGGPYGSDAYVARLQSLKVQISMSSAGKPEENGKAERLNRTLKEEEIYLNEYRNLGEATSAIDLFVRKYNQQRLHQALGYKTPSQIHGGETTP
jgi:putative transposase